jgi:hypothetical protein
VLSIKRFRRNLNEKYDERRIRVGANPFQIGKKRAAFIEKSQMISLRIDETRAILPMIYSIFPSRRGLSLGKLLDEQTKWPRCKIDRSVAQSARHVLEGPEQSDGALAVGGCPLKRCCIRPVV